MKSKAIKSILGAALLIAGVFAVQSPTEAQSLQSTFIPVGARTLVPYGWMEFCNRYQGECAADATHAEDIKLTPTNLRRISQVNRWVNANVEARADQEQWGVVDRWDYPTNGKGDCEDYVLLKRRLLIDEGFPQQALLVTVVKDERGDGHAVLTVKTNQGELILDNLRDGVKPWTQSPYKFVKRQSQSDPNLWVSIGESAGNTQVVSR
ncbi:MAG: Transglutaminase family protein cysteine peptidase [Hyphomicrobiales bacterium]|jgi:predicted transglutaminase-like cysteine proteinase|nr:Transglutaminase family protein cysteine peptidase [Hyphomicrobiales bacterium]